MIVIPISILTQNENKLQHIAMVVKESAVGAHKVQVHQMLEPKVILQITDCTRQVHQR